MEYSLSYRLGGFAPSLDPDAKAYIAAVEAADTQALESGVKKAYNNFIKGCKDDGIWDAIKASCILAGARTLTGALVSLKGTAPTNVSNNFVSADYDRKTGLKGNGTTKYLNSNRNNNTEPLNSQHLAVWVAATDTSASGTRGIIGCGVSTDASHIVLVKSVGNYFARSRSSTTIQSSAASNTGLFGITRGSSSGITYRFGGTSASPALSSVAALNSTIKVFARDAAEYWDGQISFYSIGENIDLAKLDSRVSTLMTELAAAIP